MTVYVAAMPPKLSAHPVAPKAEVLAKLVAERSRWWSSWPAPPRARRWLLAWPSSPAGHRADHELVTRENIMTRETRIGIFVGAALLILAVFIFIVGDLATLFRKPGYPLSVEFTSAAGLEKRAPVKMAGV